MCSVSVSLKPDGLGEHGTLYSESGWFMDGELVHAESQMTYESVAAILGGDGILWKEVSVSWSDTIHYYQWFTADGSDFYYIGFQVNADGSEIFNGGTWSDAVAE